MHLQTEEKCVKSFCTFQFVFAHIFNHSCHTIKLTTKKDSYEREDYPDTGSVTCLINLLAPRSDQYIDSQYIA